MLLLTALLGLGTLFASTTSFASARAGTESGRDAVAAFHLAPALGQDQDTLRSDTSSKRVDSIRITPVVRAVQKAGPSVLNIQVGSIVRGRGTPVFEKLGEGSGVIVSEEGLVLTNWHVVRFKERLGAAFVCRVKLRDERQFPARVVNVSRENDLALLLITPDDGVAHRFPPIEMGDSETLMIGETVVAIGNPRGQINTVTTGVLSAIGRSLEVKPRGELRPIRFDALLQHDAAINPGNSGGGLLDLTGRLIGINTLMQTESQNINFAIPVNHVRKIFERDLLNTSRLAIWFGFETRENQERLEIAGVIPGSPAESAGFRKGDTIEQIGKRKVADRKSYATALVTWGVGQRVPFLIGRGDEQEWKYVDAWSRSAGTVLELAGCIVETVDVRKERALYRRVLGDLYEVYDYAGGRFDLLRVRRVDSGSPAKAFGLLSGDLIVGGIVRRRGYETYFPLTGGVTELASMLQATRDGSSPELSVWRASAGLMAGRMKLRGR